jgi:hypothetical protein
MKRHLVLAVLVAALAALATCSREDGQPDPPTQVLVPCDPRAADGDPLACPPDAAIDAAIDAPVDAPTDAPAD